MSNTPNEVAMDEFFAQISSELYPEHKEQAIEEFTNEKLKSYYLQNPDVMRSAVDSIQEGNWQLKHRRNSPALIFYVIAVELLLRTTLLRPVVYGLIHNEALAEIILKRIIIQTGFTRYKELLAKIIDELAGFDVKQISRDGAKSELLVECSELQDIRNKIIHQGAICTEKEAEKGKLVSTAVFEKIVRPMLYSIGLQIVEEGKIVEV